jgi:ATP-binding cassette subfamily B protein
MAESSDEKRANLGNLRLIWRFAKRYPQYIAGALLFLVLASAATLAIPYGFKRVIDRGFGSGGASPEAVAQAFHYLLMIVVVLAAATALRFYFVSWLGERTVADLRLAVQKNLLTLPPRFFEENRPSEIASRLTADTSVLEQVAGSSFSIALRNLATGIGGIIYLFALSPKLAGMLLVGIPIVFGPVVLFGRKLRALSRSSQDRIADVGSTVSETLGAMKVVQAFGQEQREEQRFRGTVEQAFAIARRRFSVRAVMTFTIIAMVFGSIVLLLWEGASDVAAGRMSGGSIAAFVFTGVLVGGAFGALTEVYGDVLRASGAAGRISELLAARPEIHAPADPVALPQPARGALKFDDVTFLYPTRPEDKALHDLSLDIAPGETIAVVGPSGAGKSTLFQLALRFYDPQQGRVLIDGVDVRDADPAEVRKRIALVPQETVIFAASARDNIRYGRWDASDEEIVEAAKAANADEFIDALPERYDTFLGEGGARLSGGQRQRIVIARALLRDAPLLLLDEATSALDAHSERLVQEALERLMKTRTTVVIAHRLATTRAADRIIVMEGGRIVEQGTHASLNKADGLYASLARLQFAGQAA